MDKPIMGFPATSQDDYQLNVINIIKHAAGALSSQPRCTCGESLKYAIMTDRGLIPAQTREDLEPILGKYLD